MHNISLTSLDLSGLKLPSFPTQLTLLTNLKALNLARNQIRDLPQVRNGQGKGEGEEW